MLWNKLEIIKKIENLGGQYDPVSGLSLEDQLLACEAVAEGTPVGENYKRNKTNENVCVNGMLNGSHKPKGNFELTESKLQIVSQLKNCNYLTPPKKIGELLEELFKEFNSKPGHWLYIAQTYTPRGINWNLGYMIKANDLGRRTFQNWASYFTETMKYRQKRKNLRLSMMVVNKKV